MYQRKTDILGTFAEIREDQARDDMESVKLGDN